MEASPEWMTYARALCALAFVVGLIFLCAAAAKKAGLDKRLGAPGVGTRRLQIVETLYVDPRRRLMIVRKDEEEHLLLLGASGDLVVSSGARKDSHAS